MVNPMTKNHANKAKQVEHPLDKATANLYTRLEQIGSSNVREFYQLRDWNSLGRIEFCEYLGSPEVGTNFFLTALELWISQQVDPG